MSVRLFVAVALPATIRAALVPLTEELRGARWIPADQRHLTLRFLGDTPEGHLDDLRARLAGVSAPPFSVAVTGTGVFPPRPSRRSPARVLWAGLSPAAPVIALKTALDAALDADPEERGRPFSPHVTLARFKAVPGPALDDYLARHRGFCTPPFEVDAFHLYASTLGPSGARHDLMARFPLTGS